MSHSSFDLLKELGAVRPMAPANVQALVLGKWRDGFYPISWERYRHPDHGYVETWEVFGIPTAKPLTREDCERVLKAVEGK